MREAARLLELEDVELPTKPRAPAADAIAVARAVDSFLAKHRPDMARGRWIYDWSVDRAWPDADLIALALDRQSQSQTASGVAGGAGGNGIKPRELLRDERFRRAIGVNEHDGASWFNRERFERALELLEVPREAELRKAAQKSGYRLDLFEKALVAPPKWASTRPSGPKPRQPVKPPLKKVKPTATKPTRK